MNRLFKNLCEREREREIKRAREKKKIE